MRTYNRGKHPHDDAPDTAEDFLRLARLDEGSERTALRQELVRAWLPMADRLAGRFRNRGEALEDLRQVAALGLVKAVERYDPDRGGAFEAFAVPTINGEIKRHFRDHTWTVHVPRRVQNLRARVRTARQELAQTVGGREPTAAEIARHAGITEDEARAGLEALDSYNALSLDAEVQGGDDGYSLADGLGGPDPALDVVIDREAVRPRLSRLPDRERRILYMRFFRDMTQRGIAEEVGVSQMHVSRLINRCCSRLRDEVMRDAVQPGRRDGYSPPRRPSARPSRRRAPRPSVKP
ncbi:RNA polymerase sigma factor SigF [Streptomyces sp. NPDC091376]|uniref:RNA polymerase sigma factor SigF n=1 Tax=Streptomyces sp. NPDC091376 TaxID=3365994 RepID=UPI0037F94F7E